MGSASPSVRAGVGAATFWFAVLVCSFMRQPFAESAKSATRSSAGARASRAVRHAFGRKTGTGSAVKLYNE
jgi:hypothetical protein